MDNSYDGCSVPKTDESQIGNFQFLLNEEKLFLEAVGKSSTLPSVSVLDKYCCCRYCNLRLCRYDVLKARRLISSMWKNKKIKYDHKKIVRLICSTFVIIEDDLITIDSAFDGIKICPTMMSRIVAIPYTIFLRLCLEVDNMDYEHGRHGRKYMTSSTANSVGKAVDMIRRFGQDHPTGGFILPAGMTRQSFINDSGVSTSFKLSTLKKQLGVKLLFRKKDNHTRCNKCVGLGEGLKSHSSWPEEDKVIGEAMKRQHNEDIERERCVVSAAEQLSRSDPDAFLLLKCDGMGRHNTKLPHFTKRAKKVADPVRITYDVYAVQMARHNAKGNEFTNYLYTTLCGSQLANTSTTVSYLLHSLAALEVIPSTLCIVLDNCPVNKSNAFFCSLGWILYQLPNVNEMFIYYAHVGHTHNSVDGLFGNFVNILENHEAASPSISLNGDLGMDRLLSSVGSVHSVKRSASTHNWDKLLDFAVGYHCLPTQRFYKLAKDEKGDPFFVYKKCMTVEKYFKDSSGSPDHKEDNTKFYIFKNEHIDDVKTYMPSVRGLENKKIVDSCTKMVKTVGGYLDDSAISEYENIIRDNSSPESVSEDFSDILNAMLKANSQARQPVVTEYSEESIENFLAKHKLCTDNINSVVKRKKK